MQCIISDQFNFQTFQIRRNRFGIQEPLTGDFASTTGAAAVLPQIPEWINALMSILPPDFELFLALFL